MQSTSKTRNPLDLTGDDFKAMMAEIVPELSAFLDRLPESGIPPVSGPNRFLGQNATVALQVPAEQGRPLRELLDVIVQAAENDKTRRAVGRLRSFRAAVSFLPPPQILSPAYTTATPLLAWYLQPWLHWKQRFCDGSPRSWDFLRRQEVC
jgi:hypothetical protein